MNISERLDTIIEMIEPCSSLADIGCDHGIISIEAIKRGIAQRVIAADINEGPLSAARENSVREGTAPDTVFVLSDGLISLPDPGSIECIVIAGMGGILINSILEKGGLERFSALKQLVLGPQSDLDLVRRFIDEYPGLGIMRERCVFEDGKYYFLMDVRSDAHRGVRYTDAELYFGRNIEQVSSGVYSDFLHFRRRVLSDARAAAVRGKSDAARIRISDFDREIGYINNILKQEE